MLYILAAYSVSYGFSWIPRFHHGIHNTISRHINDASPNEYMNPELSENNRSHYIYSFCLCWPAVIPACVNLNPAQNREPFIPRGGPKELARTTRPFHIHDSTCYFHRMWMFCLVSWKAPAPSFVQITSCRLKDNSELFPCRCLWTSGCNPLPSQTSMGS